MTQMDLASVAHSQSNYGSISIKNAAGPDYQKYLQKARKKYAQKWMKAIWAKIKFINLLNEDKYRNNWVVLGHGKTWGDIVNKLL